ncbi:class I SAM-dependent methyltransferase [Nocardioides sambongensis]|uniref:class I SAM-dependent methyltransferase n=1 Tax=Nocardioides sambongensis TaxID=2589074 RepID=UPI0018C8B907|nr:class I SAM-dependent methyltransferase [Nocardioides sambongensis]
MIIGRPSPTHPEDFAEVWKYADTIPGWLTEDQGRLLHDSAGNLGEGAVLVEIGSHQGRSTVVLGDVARRVGGQVIAVDPFVEGRLFGGTPTRTKFLANVAGSPTPDVVRLVEEYSTKARPGWTEPIDYLYIDGKHDVWTLSDDLKWHEFLTPGGAVLIHDCYSSIGVTLGILLHVLFGNDLAYERRAGSLALFVKRRPRLRDRLRILGEMPWWIRNVFLKVLLRLRLRPVARLLGHDSPYDPY